MRAADLFERLAESSTSLRRGERRDHSAATEQPERHEEEAEEAERERRRPGAYRARTRGANGRPRRGGDARPATAEPECPFRKRRRRADDIVDRRGEEADRPEHGPARPPRRVRDPDEHEGDDRDEGEIGIARVAPVEDRTADQEEGTAHRRVNSQDDRSILADGNYVLSPDTNLWKRLSFPSLVLS